MSKIRLRTKFLLALLAVSVGLTTGTLLIVRFTVQNKVRESIRQDLRTSVKTFQILEQQRQENLARSSGFIAGLPTVRALMTTQDPPTIQDASSGLLKQSGADLLVLADRTGRISAVQSKEARLEWDHAQKLLDGTFQRGDSRDWWLVGGRLYEVQLQPIEFGQFPAETTIGILILGNEMDADAVKSFSDVAGSEVAFRWGWAVVASTLGPKEREEFAQESKIAMKGLVSEPEEVQLGRERYLVSAIQLSSGDEAPVSLSVLKSLDKATAFLDSLNRVLIGLGIVTLVAGGMLGFVIADSFTRPLANLVAGVKALERGDYEFPLGKPGNDEVGVVTNAFERMRKSLQGGQREQKELETRLRQAHKMEAVGRLAGGVAHDFNNLLTIIRGHSDLMSDRAGIDETQRRSLEQIQKASNRAVGMTRQLLAFSRMQVLQPRIVDLNAVISEMSKMLPRLIGEHIEYSFAADPQLVPVKADPGQIEQVLMNLAVNARDAMPDGGKLRARTANVVLSEADAAKRPAMGAGRYALISVSDTGHGMDEQTKAHIFEPFFTTKEVGKGTGLGLATVYGIVKQSGGFIWVESWPEKGTTFEIYFPMARGPISAGDVEAPQTSTARGTETILIAEDEAGVRELASEFLRSSGYTVLEAKDGIEALHAAENHAGTIHMLLSDVVMPRMSGQELAERLRMARPEMHVLLMSGYSEYSREKGEVRDGAAVILQKPFSLASLVGKVREVLKSAVVEQAHRGNEPRR